MHLPHHHRACFLYLGMYPEDHEIKRDDLVRQWIAEGFVNHLHGSDLEDAGKSYFNELINRSLIQPERTEYGEVLSCRVHDMMLDLILSKCAEDNFISVAYNFEGMAKENGSMNKVRRISLNLYTGGPRDDNTTPVVAIAGSLTQVRSLAGFGKYNYRLPLSLFKYLRVLVIEFSNGCTVDLTDVNQLYQLRYVKVVGSVVRLPTEIKGLVHLETLQLHCDYLSREHPREAIKQNLPSDIIHLPHLSHVIVPRGRILPEGIEKMKSLRTLSGFDPTKSSLKDIMGLGKLTNLRDLNLSMLNSFTLTITCYEALMSSIGKIRDLKCLTLGLVCNVEDKDGRLAALFKPPLHIEVLDLNFEKLSGVPQSIAYLHYLSKLSLCVRETSTEEIRILGELPSLVHLSLRVQLAGRAIVVATGLFPVLEYLLFFSYENDVTGCLEFETGAMPKLRQLHLGAASWGGATPVGMERLLGLQEIDVRVSYCCNYRQVCRDVESGFRKAAEGHPNHPSINGH